MHKVLLDAELYQDTAPAPPLSICNQRDLLNSSCSDEEEWQRERDVASLIHIFQHFLPLTSNLPENTLQIIKAHL